MSNTLVKRESLDLSAFGDISFEPIQAGIQIYRNAGILPKGMSDDAALAIAVYGFAVHGLSFPLALQNLYSVNGRIAPYTAYIAAKFLEAGHRYKILKWTGDGCRAEFYRKGDSEPICTTEFTWQEAEKARLTNKDVWKNYGKDMLGKRCLARGIRTAAPEILCGGHTFEEVRDLPPQKITPESITVDETPEPSMATARIVEHEETKHERPEARDQAEGLRKMTEPVPDTQPEEPSEYEQKALVRRKIEHNLDLLSSEYQITADAATEMYGGPLTRLKTLDTLAAAQLFTTALVTRLGLEQPYRDMSRDTYMSLVGLRVFQIAKAKGTPMKVESGVLLAAADLNEWDQGFVRGEETLLWLDDQLSEVRGPVELPETQF